jgi:hypothetical protein
MFNGMIGMNRGRPSPPKLVQSNIATGAAVSSLAVTFTSQQVDGDTNTIFVKVSTIGNILKVTDTKGNFYALVGGATITNSNKNIYTYQCLSIVGAAASGNVVTVTFAASDAAPQIAIYESTGASLDSSNAAAPNVSNPSLTLTTVAANTLILGYSVSTSTTPMTAGTGFVARQTAGSSGAYVILEDETVSTSGAHTVAASTSAGVAVSTIVAVGLTGSVNSGFLPSSIPGMKLWLRADQAITIATGVSRWGDISNNGFDVVQAVAGTQPAYSASDAGYNSQAVLTWPSVGSKILQNATIALSQPFTVLMVGENTGSTYSAWFETDVSGRVTLRQDGSGTQYELYAGSILDGGTAVHTKIAFAAIVGPSGNGGLYVNSSASTVISGAIGSNSLSQFILPGTQTDSDGFQGKIAEVIAYNSALTQGQISQIFGYFSTRYAGSWS